MVSQTSIFGLMMNPIRREKIRLGGLGTLTNQDISDLQAASHRVLELMQDGQWHTATEIIAVSKQREGLKRMRDLRRFYNIEKRRSSGREFEYKLVEK